MDDLAASIAETVRTARQGQDLSINALAERSGVSRAMIGKIERGEAQPTAVLLGRLSAALGMTLSEFVTRAEGNRLSRGADQPVWTDPETGYRRRALSAVGPLELAEVELPPGTVVAYPAEACANAHQQIWVLAGLLRYQEGETVYDLATGDCLALGPPAPRRFVNPTDEPCRYLVALARRGT
jgi:transcriptional regulator with XRE-family HTH domain